MHFQRALAWLLPFLARQVDQQLWSFWHCFSQSWRTARHLRSFLQASAWLLQCCSTHSWGVKTAKTLISIGSIPKQPCFWAHLARLIAAWLPLVGRQKLQHDDEVPHFFWQESRAGIHFESFWQAAHSLGHFCSTHCWGSFTAIAVLLVEFKQLFLIMQLK